MGPLVLGLLGLFLVVMVGAVVWRQRPPQLPRSSCTSTIH